MCIKLAEQLLVIILPSSTYSKKNHACDFVIQWKPPYKRNMTAVPFQKHTKTTFPTRNLHWPETENIIVLTRKRKNAAYRNNSWNKWLTNIAISCSEELQKYSTVALNVRLLELAALNHRKQTNIVSYFDLQMYPSRVEINFGIFFGLC